MDRAVLLSPATDVWVRAMFINVSPRKNSNQSHWNSRIVQYKVLVIERAHVLWPRPSTTNTHKSEFHKIRPQYKTTFKPNSNKKKNGKGYIFRIRWYIPACCTVYYINSDCVQGNPESGFQIRLRLGRRTVVECRKKNS